MLLLPLARTIGYSGATCHKSSYNLLSMSKASSAGKTTKFDKKACKIVNEEKVIAFAAQVGNLHYLEHCKKPQMLNVVKKCKERL